MAMLGVGYGRDEAGNASIAGLAAIAAANESQAAANLKITEGIVRASELRFWRTVTCRLTLLRSVETLIYEVEGGSGGWEGGECGVTGACGGFPAQRRSRGLRRFSGSA